MSNVFEVKDVDVFYGATQAIKTVSIDIPEHSVTAFIGPSGCGKSTLLRCFNRMNDLIPNCKVGGQILYRGQDISKMDEIDLRIKVGMVFQSPNPFPMSIYDNIAYGPRCQGIRKKEILDEIVIQSLQKAALYDEVANRLHEGGLALSGGQQQRLCIARAIAMEPDVILMDEPTSALDPISTMKIEELIFTLKDEYTIIIVTHNMQQAARVSDNTAFFLTGEIVEAGETNQIFKNPTMKKTEDYITGRFG